MTTGNETRVTGGAAHFDLGSGRPTGEIRKLTSLLEASQALANATNFKASLHRVLEILEKSHDAQRSAVALASGDQPLEVVAAMGPGRDRSWQTGLPGGALARQVFTTGRPVVVPRASREPALGERRPGDGETSFVCVPLPLNRRATGVLCVELRFKAERDYERTGKFFGVIASMIAQAIKVQRLLEAEREGLVQENVRLQGELRERYDFSHILGTSRAMHAVCEQMMQVTRTNTTVLIRGDSGTGKELIAQAIHYNSQRAAKPFVKVSCAALPDTLIESELFGYEKGAFTGAHQRKEGRFPLAAGGSLFLDEIGDMSLMAQAKLLRVLEERRFERLGGNTPIDVDFRLISATNRPLDQFVRDERFREDLYYRVNAFAIRLPSLRERASDIPLLAQRFLSRYCAANDLPPDGKTFSREAVDLFMRYHWPGNIRELESTVSRAALSSPGRVIRPVDVDFLHAGDAPGDGPLERLPTLAEIERAHIARVLESVNWNKKRAASVLAISRGTLYRKIVEYSMEAEPKPARARPR